MRRTIKYIPILMSILVSVFMFSVGFSSWLVINPTVSGDQGGSFSAYEVRELVKHNTQEMFQYSSLHFTNSEHDELDKGTISAYYVLYIDDCNKEYNGTDSSGKQISWKLTLTLSYANLVSTPAVGLFSEVNADGYSRQVTSKITAIPHFALEDDQVLASGNFTNDAESIEHDLTNNETSLTLSVDSSKLPKSGTYFLKVDYIFNIPKKTTGGVPSNFRHMFGQYIKNFKNDKTEFITIAEVEKVTKEVSGS